jgi:hypothetical protein
VTDLISVSKLGNLAGVAFIADFRSAVLVQGILEIHARHCRVYAF